MATTSTPTRSPASPTSPDFEDAHEVTSPVSATSKDSAPKASGALNGSNSTTAEEYPGPTTGESLEKRQDSHQVINGETSESDLPGENETTRGKPVQSSNNAQVDGPLADPSDSRAQENNRGPEISNIQPTDSSQSSSDKFIQNEKASPFNGLILSEPLPPSRPSEPPPLNYTLRTRKFAITFFWTLILIDSIGIPLVLYFTLDRLTSLDQNAVFSISTGCLGGISIVEYFLRFYRLWKKNSTCRVIGAHRWYLDFFHWNFSIAWIFIMFELIIGTVFKVPPIRVLAMPVASLLWWFAFELLLADTMRYLRCMAPIRMSSVPKGHPIRPAITYIIEDVVAVDGSGGTQFRIEFNERYEASHYFRQMLHRLTLFWALGCFGCALLTTVLVFTLNREVAYVVGWALPFVWAGIWVLATFPYVKRCLRREKEKWREAKVLP